MDPLLTGKVAVITGGASGIGRATALRCAAAGARVVVADVQIAVAPNEHVVVRRADVSVSAEVVDLFHWTVGEFGRLDVLISAAGISGGTGATAEYSEVEFDRVIAVNLKGVFLCMKHAITQMVRHGGGAIVNIASITGVVGLPFTPAYSAAKAGVIQLSKVAALEYADRGVRVNCICPGMIDTPMVQRLPESAQRAFIARQPIKRLGAADEIAAAAVFLASDASAFTTGAAIMIDGGYTAQ